MALVKWTVSVGGLIGSAGSNTFSRNKYANYLKQRKKSTNPQSSYQMNVRNEISSLVSAWQALDEDTQLSWNAATVYFPYTNRVGETKYYSGYDLFLKFNYTLFMCGIGVNSTPPSTVDFYHMNEFSIVSMAPLGVYLQIAVEVPTIEQSILFYATDAMSTGRNSVSESDYKFLGAFPFDNYSSLDFTSIYNARFGAIIQGKKYFWKIQNSSNVYGQRADVRFANIIAF